jgi:7-cyano-7-deazaguanine synthase
VLTPAEDEKKATTVEPAADPVKVQVGDTGRAVVVLSGGMDSTVCATLAAREYGADNVGALHVSYGQRTAAREKRAFTAVADRLGIGTRLAVETPFFRAIGGSALTDVKIAVPQAGEMIGHEIPVTYVPFRNAHLLAMAVSWAEVLGASKIYIGAVAQDSSGYPDCRPEFYEAYNLTVKRGTKAGDIEIVTPLIALRKHDIVSLGLELGAPFDLTWSCYSCEDYACGICDSCVLRLRAFEGAGAVDPIPYAPRLAESQQVFK